MPPVVLGPPTVLFLALLALAALVLAFVALSRANAVRFQLQILDAELGRLRDRLTARPGAILETAAEAVAPAAAPPAEIPAPAAPVPPLVAEPLPAPALSVPIESAVEPVIDPAIGPPSPSPPSPPPVPPPPPRVSLEERIGARLPVWIGSIALALAGAFLVKYSFDQGLLSPLVRVVLGVAFGVGLLLLGERMRRSSPGVAQGLAAAGIADLFACFLAGVHLYGLIPAAAGFFLMALTTAVAVVLALRQGPMVALIGLVGGFLTPFWIQTGDPDARALFGYLLLLQVGLLAVARRRGWAPIAALSMAGGLVWVFVWLAGPPGADGLDGTWLGLFVLLSSGVAAATVLARPRLADTSDATGAADVAPGAAGLAGGGPMLWGSLSLGLVAIGIAAQRAGHSPIEWGLFGLLAAGLLVLGRAEPAFEGLAWLAAAAGAVLLATWSPDPAELPRFLWTALGLELLFGLGAAAAAFARPGWRPPARPGRWTALAGAAVLAVFLIALAVAESDLPGFPWGLAALLHGLAFTAGTALALRWAGGRAATAAGGEAERAAAVAPPGASPASAAAGLAAAATAFVSLALPLELERAWLSVAWALEVPALLWLAGRFRLPVLTWLARLAAAAAAARLLFNPLVLDYPIGDGLLVNWLLYGYGVPLAGFAAGAFVARRQGDRRTAYGLEMGALGLALALVSLEICQAFHRGDPAAGPIGLAQWATLTVAWLGLAWLALELAGRLGERLPPVATEGAPPEASPEAVDAVREPLPSLALGGRILALAALAGIVGGQVLVLDPLWSHQPVGAMPVFNLLLWAYGAPAALLLLLARRLSSPDDEVSPRSAGWWLARGLASAGLALLFLLVTLEVRQLFHGSYLDVGTYGAAERYAYSAAWILFGTLLLALGIARRGRGLRYAALAVMTAAVFKVFLYDTSNLTGLYRVFSFLGLGAALLLLAWVYQRFVFRSGTGDGSDGSDGPGGPE